MDVADRLELHELPGRYGDAIDDRNWEGLGRIFTGDAVFDLTDLGGPRLEGLAHIRRFMADEAEHLARARRREAQQLGRYQLLDRIAFGGMAEIFLGRVAPPQDLQSDPHQHGRGRPVQHSERRALAARDVLLPQQHLLTPMPASRKWRITPLPTMPTRKPTLLRIRPICSNVWHN